MNFNIDKIIEDANEKGYSKLETARYIYLKLGEFFTYDLNVVYLMSEKYENDVYNKEIHLKDINNNQLNKKIEITCKQTADILKECIEKAGIEAENIGFLPTELRHVTTILKINGKRYALSQSKDLANIQKGFKTKHFATEEKVKEANEERFDTISEEEMRKIDKKIGYCKNDLYMDDIIEMLKKEITNDEIFKEYLVSKHTELRGQEIKKEILTRYKLDFIFNHIKNNMNPREKMEPYETYKYFKTIISELLTPEERGVRKLGNNYHSEDKFIFGFNSKSPNQKYIIYQIKLGDNYIYYQYNDEKLGFKETNIEELYKEEKNGMELYPYQMINGLKEFKEINEER